MAARAEHEELIAGGRPSEALAALQKKVREKPDDAKLRIVLFQLLAVTGDWKRAAQQLELCGQLDDGALAMVATYREAVPCEAVRDGVFAGKSTPIVFGRPEPWVASLVEALAAEGRGDTALATKLRADALEAAPATPGSLDGEPFDWIADADSRLGPVLEAVVNGRYVWIPFPAIRAIRIEPPTDLRDLVWTPAMLTLATGAEQIALVPTRYAGNGALADGALQLARKTEWVEIGAGQYRGLGQRLFTTSGPEAGLLQVREVVLDAASADASAGVPPLADAG
jgi:type VI secretion system protein ImpE